MKIRVLLIEDHAIVQEGLSALLEKDPDIQVVAKTCTGKGALEMARDYPIDVAILDAHLPDISGIEVARKLFIHAPDIRVVVLTGTTGTILAKRFLAMEGVRGYITKESGQEELLLAIRSVFLGQRYLTSDIAPALAWSKHSSKIPFDDLTRRETEVLMALLKNQKVKELAKQLNISPKTVHAYRYRIMKKLGVKNNVELIQLAQQYKLQDAGSISTTDEQ